MIFFYFFFIKNNFLEKNCRSVCLLSVPKNFISSIEQLKM